MYNKRCIFYEHWPSWAHCWLLKDPHAHISSAPSQECQDSRNCVYMLTTGLHTFPWLYIISFVKNIHLPMFKHVVLTSSYKWRLQKMNKSWWRSASRIITFLRPLPIPFLPLSLFRPWLRYNYFCKNICNVNVARISRNKKFGQCITPIQSVTTSFTCTVSIIIFVLVLFLANHFTLQVML